MIKRTIVSLKFFEQPTLKVAQKLLGKILARKINNKVYRYRIVETEAYCGENDLACHTSKGKTKRTEVMFRSAGHIYIYLIYGMYYCLNIVTRKKGAGEAVLIRAVEPLSNPSDSTNGPGKLCKVLKIDRGLNQQKLGRRTGLWVEDDGFRIRLRDIGVSSRRGVSYAKHCADYPWRFFLKSSEFVS